MTVSYMKFSIWEIANYSGFQPAQTWVCSTVWCFKPCGLSAWRCLSIHSKPLLAAWVVWHPLAQCLSLFTPLCLDIRVSLIFCLLAVLHQHHPTVSPNKDLFLMAFESHLWTKCKKKLLNSFSLQRLNLVKTSPDRIQNTFLI